MFDPNAPAPPPGTMQTMGIGGGASTPFARPPRMGGPTDGGGGPATSPMVPPAAPGVTPPVGPVPPPSFGNDRFTMGWQKMGGMDNSNLQAIMQALQGWRDARQAWVQGGRVGERPNIRGYLTGNPLLGALGGTQGAPGATIPGAIPGQVPTQVAPANMVGSSLGVPGATPAASGFDLPSY